MSDQVMNNDKEMTTWQFIKSEFKPKGKMCTPFNIISGAIVLVGLCIIVLRFAKGIGAVTNLSQAYPWGLWIGFDVLVGIAFAGGAYSLAFIIYMMGADKYHPVIRAVTLNGFLAYTFYAGALLLDLGRPWNAFNFIIGNNFGTSSIMFMVAWHFVLYILCLALEFSPAFAEWIDNKKLWKVLNFMYLGAAVFGITLCLGHQAGVGALFLLSKAKMHPLWFSELIPMLFFLSSIFAGLSMVIVEGSVSHKAFKQRLSEENEETHDGIVLGLGRICAYVMYVYFLVKGVELMHEGTISYLASGYGLWYLVEVIGFVLVPAILFERAYKNRSVSTAKLAAILTMVGIAINRFNLCIIGYNWENPAVYFPSWMEIMVTLTVVFIELWVYRWIVLRMPVLGDGPDWARHQEKHAPAVADKA